MSLPEVWKIADIFDGVKLAFFLTKRFVYICYKAKVEPLFHITAEKAEADAVNMEEVAKAMDKASEIYTAKVSADKSVIRGAIKGVPETAQIAGKVVGQQEKVAHESSHS